MPDGLLVGRGCLDISAAFEGRVVVESSICQDQWSERDPDSRRYRDIRVKTGIGKLKNTYLEVNVKAMCSIWY